MTNLSLTVDRRALHLHHLTTQHTHTTHSLSKTPQVHTSTLARAAYDTN